MTLPWDSDTSWGPNWNSGEDFSKAAAITANKADFVRDYRNVVREFRDLVWQRDQIEPMLDLLQSRLAPFHLADRDRWTGAPAAAGSQTDGPLATRVADMKRFAFIGGSWEGGNDPSDTQSKDTGLSGQQGRDAYLDYLQTDAAIPATPTVTYTGPAGYPANSLTFTSSAFSDPQGDGTFGAHGVAHRRIQAGRHPTGRRAAHRRRKRLGNTTTPASISAPRGARSVMTTQPGRPGPGEFGYGETGLGTTLVWGPDALNRWPTYYFRRTFTASELDRFTGIRVGVRRDDGAVVYLNGIEVFRTGMPAAPATITYTTRATSDQNGVNETTYFSTVLPVTSLVAGENTIAVELHQFSASNTDLRFDLTLGGVYPASSASDRTHLGIRAPLEVTTHHAIQSGGHHSGRRRSRKSHLSRPGAPPGHDRALESLVGAGQFVTSSPGIQPLLEHLAISEIHLRPASRVARPNRSPAGPRRISSGSSWRTAAPR